MKPYYIKRIVLEIMAGESIDRAITQAVLAAAKNKVDVEFTFNSKTYDVKIDDLCNCVKERTR